MLYSQMSAAELEALCGELEKKYNELAGLGLQLDMTRGKPCAQQLELSSGLLNCVDDEDMICGNTDCRNYGELRGIPAARELFAEILGEDAENIMVGGNSSLQLMFNLITMAYCFGLPASPRPWKDEAEVKFICPVPGYDRHFAITQLFGIKMINVAMTANGPDMDAVEELVRDPSVKGMWNIPVYSNPTGVVYSHETISRLAGMKPAAPDFAIIWDNAYGVHNFTDDIAPIPNLLTECEKHGRSEMAFVFASTSKITFPGGGIAAMCANKENLDAAVRFISKQIICFEKINQLRHVKFIESVGGVRAQMRRHAEILAPKFEMVQRILTEELAGTGTAHWMEPSGGYFFSIDTMDGCAKQIVALCADAGALFTPAGATYPYGENPRDNNIRLAPTYPPIAEVESAMRLFCTAVKLVSVKKILGRV